MAFQSQVDWGMDSFKKRYEDLQNLIIDYTNQPLPLTESNQQ